MTKVPGQEADYLDLLVRKEIEEIRRIGPMGGDILRVLENSGAPLEVRTLAQKTLDAESISADVAADALRMRRGPSPDETIVKVLPKGSRLTILDNGNEARIGQPGLWLRVADTTGTSGFVMADYLVQAQTPQAAEEKIDSIMVTLEQFDQMELVEISQQGGLHYVSLTQRGKYVFEYMSKQTNVKG